MDDMRAFARIDVLAESASGEALAIDRNEARGGRRGVAAVRAGLGARWCAAGGHQYPTRGVYAVATDMSLPGQVHEAGASTVDVTALVTSVCQDLADLARQRNVSLAPVAGPPGAMVSGDSAELEQALRALLEVLLVGATPQHVIAVQVSGGLRAHADVIVTMLAVRCIEAAEADMIPLQRPPGWENAALRAVERTVEGHGGAMEAIQEGWSAGFRIRLPVLPRRAPAVESGLPLWRPRMECDARTRRADAIAA
jgi:hypothetical protein